MLQSLTPSRSDAFITDWHAYKPQIAIGPAPVSVKYRASLPRRETLILFLIALATWKDFGGVGLSIQETNTTREYATSTTTWPVCPLLYGFLYYIAPILALCLGGCYGSRPVRWLRRRRRFRNNGGYVSHGTFLLRGSTFLPLL